MVAGARAAAETMRGAIEARDLDAEQSVRDVKVLRDAADTIPGSPQVTGITDGNGDTKDDDGKVTVRVGDQAACLTADTNGDIDVTDGEC
jgi:hypothetical protein